MRQKSQLKNSLSFNHAPITPDHEPGPSNQRLVLTNNGSRLVIGMGDEAQLEVGPIPPLSQLYYYYYVYRYIILYLSNSKINMYIKYISLFKSLI